MGEGADLWSTVRHIAATPTEPCWFDPTRQLMSHAVVLGKVGCSISGSVGSVAQVPNDF